MLIRKYPRTPHLAGSALQAGDDGSDRVTIRELRARYGATIARYKLVRDGFVQTILESGTHWHDRPIIRNGLAPGVDIMAEPDLSGPEL